MTAPGPGRIPGLDEYGRCMRLPGPATPADLEAAYGPLFGDDDPPEGATPCPGCGRPVIKRGTAVGWWWQDGKRATRCSGGGEHRGPGGVKQNPAP